MQQRKEIVYSGNRDWDYQGLQLSFLIASQEKATFEKRMKGGEGVEHADSGNSQGNAPRQDHTREFLQEQPKLVA